MEIVTGVRASNADELERELEAPEEIPPVVRAEQERLRSVERSVHQMQHALELLVSRTENEERHNEPGPSTRSFYNPGSRVYRNRNSS